MAIRPGEVYFADIGGEEMHRVVIVSRESINRGKYVIAIPFTSSQFEERRRLSQCVVFAAGEAGMTKDCVARADNISMLSVSRLDLETGPIGRVEDERMRELIRALGYVVEA